MRKLDKTLVLVGMMGAGKTSVGRRLAGALGVPFRDADVEIEAAAGCTINEIFERYRRARLPQRRTQSDCPAARRAAACAGRGRRRLHRRRNAAADQGTCRVDLAARAARSPDRARAAQGYATAAAQYRQPRDARTPACASASRSMRRPTSSSNPTRVRTMWW